MARLKRVKQRLVHEAIQDNVKLIRGLPLEIRRRQRRRFLSRSFTFGLVPLVLVASAYAVANSRRPFDSFISTLPALPVQLESPSAPEETQSELESQLAKARFEAPEAVDPKVLPLGVGRIVLDPGHGGTFSGTVTSNGIQEKHLTLDIGLRLRDLLEEAGYEVVLTRDADVGVTLEERVKLANELEGDLFVSIHLNWISTRHTRGVETYYLGPTTDPYLTELASAENRDSGYSLADFRRLLEGIYADVRGSESRRLAESVHGALYRALRKVNPRVENRGVKTAPFVVLIGTRMPAILAEVSCLSNRREAELLQRERYRQYIADALAGGVRSYADSLNQIAEKGTPDER